MKKINVLLRNEICELEKLVKEARDRIRSAPSGTLRISGKKQGTEYYIKESNSGCSNGKYIKKGEVEIAYKLAQREYDAQLVKLAEERLGVIRRFLELYNETDLSLIYQNSNPYRQELIKLPVLPDDEYIRNWQSVQYVGKAFAEAAPEIITERGERVRSKSEKIIADKLYALGIPYRYEYPLILPGNVKLYPDFTILRMPEREEVFLEHLGMMDDDNYVETVMYKLNKYEKNGIFLGVNLFITYETVKVPLNTRMVERLLKRRFL